MALRLLKLPDNIIIISRGLTTNSSFFDASKFNFHKIPGKSTFTAITLTFPKALFVVFFFEAFSQAPAGQLGLRSFYQVVRVIFFCFPVFFQ